MASLGESRPDFRSKTVATLCSKGGVGKSTLSAQLLDNAARLGLRVAGVDLDPNGTLSRLTGTVAPVGEPSVREVLEGSASPQSVARKPIAWQPEAAADRSWLQGGPLLPGGVVHMVPAPDRGLDAVTSRSGTDVENALLEAITMSGFGEHYDMIVVDPPASTSSTLYLALNASQHLVLPLQTESAALSGLILTLEAAIKFSSNTGRPVNGIGVVATMLDRTTEHTETLEAARAWISDRFAGQMTVLNPQIPRRTIIADSAARMIPVSRQVTGSGRYGDVAARYAAVTLSVVASVVPEKIGPIFDALEALNMPDELAEIVYAGFDTTADADADAS
ncbi:AAA family ATPase [Rhodococcus hoagii]|nr:AAA family ATPase [Prescottella equi]